MTETTRRVGEAINTAMVRRMSQDGVARAALEAIREPTEEVREALNRHASNGMVNWEDYHRAMIDAALKESAMKITEYGLPNGYSIVRSDDRTWFIRRGNAEVLRVVTLGNFADDEVANFARAMLGVPSSPQ